MTSPGAAITPRQEEPILKNMLERFEVLLVRVSELSNRTKNMRMRYLGMEPSKEAPSTEPEIPPDLYTRLSEDINRLDSLTSEIDVDVTRLDAAY